MHEEIRREILRLLNAAGTGATFFDYVAQGTPTLPYGVLGETVVTPEDTSDADGALVRLPVSIFSKYKGGKQNAAILDATREALHHKEASLVLTTCDAVTMYVEGTTEDPNTDEGRTREAVATVAVRVYGIAAGTA